MEGSKLRLSEYLNPNPYSKKNFAWKPESRFSGLVGHMMRFEILRLTQKDMHLEKVDMSFRQQSSLLSINSVIA